MFELPLRQGRPPSADNTLLLYEGVRIAGRFVLGRMVDGSDESVTFEGYDLHSEGWVRVRFRLSPSFRDLRLAHPGISQFQDHGCVGDWYVSSMDPGEGEGLDLFVQRTRGAPLEFTAVVGLGIELLTLLDLPHHTGAYHGNLSLSSLHVTPDWGVQIVDFPDRVGELSQSASPFASPERQVGHQGDERSDVYSAGAILYTLFTGKAPFGNDPVTARHGHLYNRLVPDPTLPEPLFEVLETAMAKRPDHRYPTTEGLCAALRDAFMEISLGFPELTLETPDFWDLPQMALGEPTMDPAPEREVAAPARARTPGRDTHPDADEPQTVASSQPSRVATVLTQVAIALLCLASSTMAGAASTAAFGVWLLVG